MNNLLDAIDELSSAENLVRLIAMTARSAPDDEQKAISAGCAAIEAHFAAAFALLNESKKEASA